MVPQFVEWSLEEGETVVFDFRNFVGMSSSVRLHTVFSYRLATMMLGRLFYSAATGPGRLIFKTDGKPIIGKETEASFDSVQLVAWHIDSSFSVASERSFVQTYLSDVQLKKEHGNPVILDVTRRRRIQLGLLRYVLLHFH